MPRSPLLVCRLRIGTDPGLPSNAMGNDRTYWPLQHHDVAINFAGGAVDFLVGLTHVVLKVREGWLKFRSGWDVGGPEFAGGRYTADPKKLTSFLMRCAPHGSRAQHTEWNLRTLAYAAVTF